MIGYLVLSMVIAALVWALSFAMGRAHRFKLDAEFAQDIIDQLRAELMQAEARSRGVGGTGEHGAPVVRLVTFEGRQVQGLGLPIPKG